MTNKTLGPGDWTDQDWATVAVNLGTLLGLTPTELAQVYGESANTVEELIRLSEKLPRNLSDDMGKRITTLLEITVLLEALKVDKPVFISKQMPALEGKTIKELLVSNDTSNVERVLGFWSILQAVRLRPKPSCLRNSSTPLREGSHFSRLLPKSGSTWCGRSFNCIDHSFQYYCRRQLIRCLTIHL